MSYRENGGPSIDELQQEIELLRSDNETLRAEYEAIKEGKVMKGLKEAFVVVLFGIAAASLIFAARSCHMRQAREEQATAAHNEKMEKRVFAGAHAWIKNYHRNEGDAWCRFDDTVKSDDRIREDGLVYCYLMLENSNAVVKLDCSPKLSRCYKRGAAIDVPAQ